MSTTPYKIILIGGPKDGDIIQTSIKKSSRLVFPVINEKLAVFAVDGPLTYATLTKHVTYNICCIGGFNNSLYIGVYEDITLDQAIELLITSYQKDKKS